MSRARARAQFALLLRTHFLLLKRQATATMGRRVVMTLLVGFGAVASALLGLTALWGLWISRHKAGVPAASLDEAVHLSFALVWVVLVLSPALGFRAHEFLDVTRLFHLPVSHRTVFSASTAGISLSGAVLFWVPPLAGVVVGHKHPMSTRHYWGRMDWAGLDFPVLGIRLLLSALFLVHAVLLGQLLVLLLLNFLRSRRFQDLGMVVAPLVAGAVYLGAWFALTRGRTGRPAGHGLLREVLALEPSRWFPFLPSRWLTEAVVEAGRGGAVHALPLLLGFLPLTFMALALAAHLQERAFLGDVPPLEAGGGGSGRRIPGGALLRRFFPDPVLAIASKELRLLRREPIVKTTLISQACFLILPIVAVTLRPGGSGDSVGTVARISWALPFVLVFVENTLLMNLLGLEGPGISHLRTTPVSWRRIVAGKDLCYLLGFGAVNALLSAAVLGLLAWKRPDRVPDPLSSIALAVIGGACALAVVTAVGNVVSVALPSTLATRGRMALRQQGAFSEGCYEKLTKVAVFAGTLVLVAPVPMALHVLPANAGWLFQEAWWPPLGAVLCAVYAAVLLRASFPLAERMAREGEEAIVHRLVRSGE